MFTQMLLYILAIEFSPKYAISNLYIAWRYPVAQGSVFENNRTQAVRLPAETRFPPGVKKVHVRVVGQDRILSPVGHGWDSFFQSTEDVTEDFMVERSLNTQADRESL